ncbi:diguanylate cyclase [Aurantimonas sp. HBX-1]|uniref:GGDEF domain-containing protein n=1 Tax=Aurantimonas sp. HBX-1 TaxID=2906072 RepID=UPI001F16541E|nr:GGDEF domain-containing protein [Aurantimonas sp. HBX-1]UIJ72391.1 GGDEF domain-containing protein [Aurantimonas sp. HBX-1]
MRKRLKRWIRGDDVVLPVFAEMIELMYGSFVPLIASVVGLHLIAVFAGFRTGDPVLVLLAIAGCCIGYARIGIGLAYRHRRRRWLDRLAARRWQNLYALGGIPYCTTNGILIIVAMHSGDPYVFAWCGGFLVANAYGLVMYTAVRPAVAMIQVSLTMLPVTFVCLASGRFELTILGLNLVLAIAALLINLRRQYLTIREMLESRRSLERFATTDPLTGLLNRNSLLRQIDDPERRPAGSRALLFIDLDRFKPVNDEHGHQAGDELLAQLAVRLRRCIGERDLLARFGGDEFVIVCESRTAEALTTAETLARRIRDSLDEPFRLASASVMIGASIGIARIPGGRVDIDRLIGEADDAMYAAKRARREAAAPAEGRRQELAA